jgi:hypothetical protein
MKTKKMPAKAKNFILKKLIPFIMRKQGRGFRMDFWLEHDEPGEIFESDFVNRKVPKCGTVCCIGGSIEYLTGKRTGLAKAIGLTPRQADGLFNEWLYDSEYPYKFAWPEKFSNRFREKTTPIGKAKVACDLLREVVKTNGECLKNPNYKEI